MDERLERSISTGVTSKPASFIVLAIACAFSNYLSPTTIFIPAHAAGDGHADLSGTGP